MTTITEQIELQVINCGECGGSYAINSRYYEQSRKEARCWNCPYCKTGWGFSGHKTEAQKLAAQLDQERTRLRNQKAETQRAREDAETNRRLMIGQKAAKTRIKNRVAKGVCPCCNRSFTNLHRHMQSKHPEYSGND